MARVGDRRKRREKDVRKEGRAGRRSLRAWWRDASLKTSFMAYMVGFLLLALAGSSLTSALFGLMQNEATQDLADLAGIYAYDPEADELYQAEGVVVASREDGYLREVFVESARSRLAALDPAELGSSAVLEDITGYLFPAGYLAYDGGLSDAAYTVYLSVEGAVADLLDQELTPANIASYDAAARSVVERENAYYLGSDAAADTRGETAGETASLRTSPVGYYVYVRPTLGARVMSGVFGTLSFLMFPLWFGLCIWAAARRFFDRRIRPALAELDGAAAKIAAQDLDFSVAYPRNDEMGRLAASFETMRASLAAGQRTLWRTAEERKRLNAAFAHDLRTPLTVLHGTVELMQARAEAGAADPARTAADCAALAQQVGRLERYVEAMGGIQRLEDRAASPAPTPLADVARDAAAAGTAVCRRAGVAFGLDASGLPAEEGAAAALDRGLVLEVAENLLGNAARYAAATVWASLRLECGVTDGASPLGNGGAGPEMGGGARDGGIRNNPDAETGGGKDPAAPGDGPDGRRLWRSPRRGRKRAAKRRGLPECRGAKRTGDGARSDAARAGGTPRHAPDAGCPEAGAARFLVLTVEDDGPGFSDEALRRGCAPFFSESKGAGNFGLGLNIAQLLCEKHGGSLELANRPEGGARAVARFALGGAPAAGR